MQRQDKTSSVFIVFVTLLALTVGSVASPAPVRAASTITVTTIADNTPTDTFCSLREAIHNANYDAAIYPDCAAGSGNDTILFALNTSAREIVLLKTLHIRDTDGLTIDGGEVFPSISGNHYYQALIVETGASLTLRHLEVMSAHTSSKGGGVLNNGTLTIANSIFAGNDAQNGGGAISNVGTLTITDSIFDGNVSTSSSFTLGGGAIYNAGSLSIRSSTFGYNHAAAGGAIYNDVEGTLSIKASTFVSNRSVSGAIFNYSGHTATISNSTFTDNRATDIGGAIFNGKTLTIFNSTFSRNSSIPHGGGDIYMMYPGARLDLWNNIFANSQGGGHCNKAEGTVSGSNNLFEDAASTCGLMNGVNGNLTGFDPVLGPLTGDPDSVMSPHYFPLNSGSRAIDAGSDANCPATDQRGVTRPHGSHCDIGSYEYKSP